MKDVIHEIIYSIIIIIIINAINVNGIGSYQPLIVIAFPEMKAAVNHEIIVLILIITCGLFHFYNNL